MTAVPSVLDRLIAVPTLTRGRNWRNHLVRWWLRAHRLECHGEQPWLTGRFPGIHLDQHARIILGSGCTLGSEAQLAAYGRGVIEIGDGAFINTYRGAISANTRISIGAHCLIADHVFLRDDTFHDISPDSPRRIAPITLGRNVWLSSYVRVFPGITIGDHTVVGTGSIVTHDLPERCLAAGVPARVIRHFDCPDDWHRK